MVSLTVYDGAYGIGGNKLYLEENGNGVFLDFGKNFGKCGIAFFGSFQVRHLNRNTKGFNHLELKGLMLKNRGTFP